MSVEDLAIEMLRLFLANLILCNDDVEEEDAYFWSMLYVEEGANKMVKEIMAYRNAKRRVKASRSGKPENVVAVLLYNISHTGTHDRQTAQQWRERLDNGYSLSQITRLDQAMDLIKKLNGSYLTESDIGALIGHSVNIGRMAGLIQDEYQCLGEE